MNTEKNIFFLNKKTFICSKVFFWICAGLLFFNFSILIPVASQDMSREFIVFICLAFVVNLNISYIDSIVSKKSKALYFILLAGSIFGCSLLELLLFAKNIGRVYSFLDKSKIFLLVCAYTTIRNFAIYVFFLWIEYFYQLYHLYHEKEKIHKEEIALLIEKQEFEKIFSRKKLLPHYFFNILEHINVETLANNSGNELIDKIKFILYYFLVDAENDKIELNKELAFYKYYIELEKFRHRKDILVNLNVLGQPESYTTIPLLFEPLIGNAIKYTNHDGGGWVDITVDALHFPILRFHCKNKNYPRCSQNITSTESGLNILKQRLELCYKNKHSLKITQEDDLYEVILIVEVV